MKEHVKHLVDISDVRTLALGELPVSTNDVVQSNKKELAEVLSFDPDSNSYIVITRGVPGNPRQPGGRQLRDIPRKVSDPGVESPIPIGTVVVIEWALGFPYIDGILYIDGSRYSLDKNPAKAPSMSGQASSPETNIMTPTDSSKESNVRGGFYRQPGVPADLMEGDKILTTPDGNRIAALRGNYNVIDGGPQSKARLEVFGSKDLVRTICERCEHITGFGVLDIGNAEGRCGLEFKAAADQLTESGGNEEQWTFKLAIGAPGDYFLMEVNSPDGATKARYHISPDGHVTQIATNGFDIINGSTTPSHREYAGSLIERIAGGVKKIVEGSVNETFYSSRNTSISVSDSKVVGNNESTSVNNHQILSVGGRQEVLISGGGPIDATPANIAVSMQVLNGSYVLELGNPTAGANPLAEASATIAVNNGDVTLGQNPDPLSIPAIRARASLNTLLPNSAAVGGSADPTSPYFITTHAVLFEQLQIFLTALLTAFDTHIHGSTPVPSTLLSPTLGLTIPGLMSTRVLVGP